jgi:intracellular sulfur oxidation DsrE/DsrF family protein
MNVLTVVLVHLNALLAVFLKAIANIVLMNQCALIVVLVLAYALLMLQSKTNYGKVYLKLVLIKL